MRVFCGDEVAAELDRGVYTVEHVVADLERVGAEALAASRSAGEALRLVVAGEVLAASLDSWYGEGVALWCEEEPGVLVDAVLAA